MHELSNKIFTQDCDVKLKDCEYRFYRGSEWLRLHDNSFIYELCASNGGAYLALNVYVYDYDLGKRKQVSRKVLNGFGKMELAV